MAISVMTNVPSLNAQRNLNTNATNLGKALSRLSSGLRINSASDDAAGLAISTGLQSQVKGMSQAIRNAGDGLSLLGSAEGGLVEQTNILQRMRELAVQSSNDTNSSANRTSLNGEATQLKNELDRIAKTLSFNGSNLLDGTFQGKDLQVGAMSTANDRITVSIGSTRANAIGSAYKTTGAAITSTAALASGDIAITVGSAAAVSIDVSSSDGVSTVAADGSALAKANAINAKSYLTGVSAEATNSATAAADQDSTSNGGAIIDNDLKINGVNIGPATITADTDSGIVNAINSKFAQTGVMASLGSDNKIVLSAADGRNIDVAATARGTAVSGIATGTTAGTITLRSTEQFTLAVANGTRHGLSAGTATQATSENVQAIDLASKSGSQLAIKIIDTALDQINNRRADIGSLTNRLNTTISNLASASENAQASNSRIMDADFAQETAAMSRSQILQQAGVAVLSQANQAPQMALSLLK